MFAELRSGSTYCWRRLQAATDPISIKYWAGVACAGRYPFSPSQYFMLAGFRAHSIHRPNVVKMLASVMHNDPASD